MKSLLLVLAVVLGQSVLEADKKPLIADPIVEKAIRQSLKKPTGELTEADLEKVTFLSLNETNLTDVSALTGLKKLTYLYLGGNKLTDKNLKHLVGLTQLKRLNLISNQLTDVNALAGLTQMKTLYLNGNQLNDVGALAGLTQLTGLHLVGNQLNDVSALAGLTQLRELNLRDNPNLTKAQIDELRKALPKCKIVHNATKQPPNAPPASTAPLTPTTAAGIPHVVIKSYNGNNLLNLLLPRHWV